MLKTFAFFKIVLFGYNCFTFTYLYFTFDFSSNEVEKNLFILFGRKEESGFFVANNESKQLN